MVTSNKNLMAQAREALSGRWGLAVGVYFIYILFVVATEIPGLLIKNPLSSLIGFVLILLIGGVFALGLANFDLAIARKKDANVQMVFSGFERFGRATGLFLLMMFLVFLWTLLLIIPGIIAAISYAMAFYIMSDNPNVGLWEALDKSKKMMKGYKWKYFCLCLRFLGWILLGILTLGIGLLWVIPYMAVSCANFYNDLKANSTEVQ